ncbi:MAG: fibronectin type III domain-containing protein [Bdellovibrionales bacterium]|nr:fibronectin type III domain-containing protein [Bdellovibrionales bacterium]
MNVLRCLTVLAGHTSKAGLLITASIYLVGCGGGQPPIDEEFGGALKLAPVTSITLQSPSSSPSPNPSITLRVAGVASGELVEVHFNSTCTSIAGSQTATSETVDVSISSLATGTYSLYARRVSSTTSAVSPCSSATASYEVIGSSLVVTGLTNDANAAQSKNWSWSCSGAITSCEYRYAVNTNPAFAFSSEPYSATSSTSQAGVTGTYYLHVQARDAYATTIVSPQVTVSAELDNTAPTEPSSLSRNNPTAGVAADNTPEIEVSGVVSGDTVTLYSDSCLTAVGSVVSTGSSVIVEASTLLDGSYTFHAASADSAGNVSGCSVANVTYTVDTTSPAAPTSLALAFGLNTTDSDETPDIIISGLVAGDSVVLYSDACSTAVASGTATGSSITLTSTALTEGSYSFFADSTDPVGNSSSCSVSSVSYTYQAAPDAPTGLALDAGIQPIDNNPTPVVVVSGVTVGDTIRLYSDACVTDVATGIAGGASINLTASSLPDGSYTFYADAENSSGGRSTCSVATVNYTLDTVAPTAPSSLTLEGGLSAIDNDSTPGVVVFGVNPGETVTLFSDACVTALGTVGSTGASVTVTSSSLTDGAYTFYASTTDEAGNPSACSSATVSYLLDTVLPTVSITSAPDITAANQGSYSVVGTCSESGVSVSLNVGSLLVSPVCSAGSFSTGTLELSGQADNPSFLITAGHVDAAGNSATQASVTVVKDTLSDTVAITSAPDIDNSNEFSYALSGTCSGNGSQVSVFVDSLSFNTNCNLGFWSLSSLNVSTVTDSASVLVTADHLTAPTASVNVAKDSAAPTVGFSSAPNINSTNEATYLVSGTCSENGQNVDVEIPGVTPFSVVCSSGSWTSGSRDVSGLADSDSITITADHQNASAVAANQAVQVVSKNTATPVVTSLSVPSTLSNSADLTWSVINPGGFTINDYEIQYRVSGTTTWLNFNDGVSTVTSATVTGLQPSTTYEFQVRVSYDSSFSDYSQLSSGSTKPDSTLFDSPYKAMNVGGATTSNIVAFYDDTYVTINGVTIPESPLAKGEVVNLPGTKQFDVIDADKPIFTAGRRGSGGNTNKANIVWSPTYWAGKTFSFNAIRDNAQELSIYATEAAYVEVRQGATVLATANLNAEEDTTLTWSVYGSYQVVSTGAILAYHISVRTGDRTVDPKPLLPSHTEIIGVPSSSMRLTADSNGTNYSFVHSNSETGSGNLNAEDVVPLSPEGTSNQYNPSSLLISADRPVSGASFADSDGNCAAPFIPTNLMKRRYAINVVSEWVAFASKEAGIIQVYSPTQTIGVDTPVHTLILDSGGAEVNRPYKARMANPASGYRFISTVPVAAWYEPNSDTGAAVEDETILYGTDD